MAQIIHFIGWNTFCRMLFRNNGTTAHTYIHIHTHTHTENTYQTAKPYLPLGVASKIRSPSFRIFSVFANLLPSAELSGSGPSIKLRFNTPFSRSSIGQGSSQPNRHDRPGGNASPAPGTDACLKQARTHGTCVCVLQSLQQQNEHQAVMFDILAFFTAGSRAYTANQIAQVLLSMETW